MIKILFSLFFSALLGLQAAKADVWTSVNGETLRGDFIRYDVDAGMITIRREYDRREFDIPETQLIHANRLKAVELQNSSVEPYWYESYSALRSKRANDKKRILVFYRNEGDAEAFELFYHKFLLRPDFQQYLKRNNFVVCVDDRLPDEFRELFTMGDKPDDRVLRKEPLLLYSFERTSQAGGSTTTQSVIFLTGGHVAGGGNPFGAGTEEKPTVADQRGEGSEHKSEYYTLAELEAIVAETMKIGSGRTRP